MGAPKPHDAPHRSIRVGKNRWVVPTVMVSVASSDAAAWQKEAEKLQFEFDPVVAG